MKKTTKYNTRLGKDLSASFSGLFSYKVKKMKK